MNDPTTAAAVNGAGDRYRGNGAGRPAPAAEKRLERLNRRRRETCPASDLVVGLQCGGSDAFSGVTCNPAVGYAADLLVRAGATVMFSEVTEVRDAIHLLTPRAATADVARDLIREMQWYDDYLALGRADRAANTTPGNKRGGLAKALKDTADFLKAEKRIKDAPALAAFEKGVNPCYLEKAVK